VSTRAGGVPAILIDGRHGLLAPLGDHETMGRSILHLLEAPAFARGLARAAYGTCGACTWPAVRERWLATYRSVLSGNTEAALASLEHQGHDPA